MVVDMAWLLGFWLGDGYTRGATFALNSEDHDVNNHLQAVGESWGMEYTFKKREGLRANGTLKNDDRVNTFDNRLVSILVYLGFYKGHVTQSEKAAPSFLISDERDIRLHYLAGLIDSDGCTRMIDGIPRIKIVSIYPSLRDSIIGVVKSLGLRVTVSLEKAHVTKQGANAKDTWIMNIFKGFNEESFYDVLRVCSCKRRFDMPVTITARKRKYLEALQLQTDGDTSVDI